MLYDRLKEYRIILASRSPRRQQLLRQMKITFDVVIRDYDETFLPGMTGEEIACHIAESKAQLFREEIGEKEIVLTADTIVWCNNKILGKPVDRDEAILMLGEISGRTHEVITGVCLLSKKRSITFSDCTRVTFNKLYQDEIEFYVDNYKPFDKAGAYGIQEWIGIIACSNIEGSFFNVVGLPVTKLYAELNNFINY